MLELAINIIIGILSSIEMLKLILEFIPLLVFLLTYKGFNMIVAAIIMFGTLVICNGIIYFTDRKFSPTLLLSGAILSVAILISLITDDIKYFKMKPSILYIIFAVTLYAGAALKRPVIKDTFSHIAEMTDNNWVILSVRFGHYFVFMALINEYIWRNYSDDFWVNFKVFGAIPISLLFVISQMPFIFKHNIKNINTRNNEEKTRK